MLLFCATVTSINSSGQRCFSSDSNTTMYDSSICYQKIKLMYYLICYSDVYLFCNYIRISLVGWPYCSSSLLLGLISYFSSGAVPRSVTLLIHFLTGATLPLVLAFILVLLAGPSVFLSLFIIFYWEERVWWQRSLLFPLFIFISFRLALRQYEMIEEIRTKNALSFST